MTALSFARCIESGLPAITLPAPVGVTTPVLGVAGSSRADSLGRAVRPGIRRSANGSLSVVIRPGVWCSAVVALTGGVLSGGWVIVAIRWHIPVGMSIHRSVSGVWRNTGRPYLCRPVAIISLASAVRPVIRRSGGVSLSVVGWPGIGTIVAIVPVTRYRPGRGVSAVTALPVAVRTSDIGPVSDGL